MPATPTSVKLPVIDDRTYGDLVTELETLARQYTAGEVEANAVALTGAVLDEDVMDGAELVAKADGLPLDAALAARIENIAALDFVRVRGWVPAGQQPAGQHEPLDAGGALIRIFSRLAELAVDRINQLPQRNYLAFLDLIGTRPSPPQPARVPLTFNLAAGSQSDALVPARTQVAAAPLETDTAPVLFETERALVVTRSQLVAAWTRDPEADSYRDSTAVVTGLVAGTTPVFRGDQPIQHVLYLGQQRLLGMPETKDVFIDLTTAQEDFRWLDDVIWERWDGAAWAELEPGWVFDGTTHKLSFPAVPQIPPSAVDGVTSSWIRARLHGGLPPGQVETDAAGNPVLRREIFPYRAESFGHQVPTLSHDLRRTFYPFGKTERRTMFQLLYDVSDIRPGGEVEIEILLDETRLPEPSPELLLTWYYMDGNQVLEIPGLGFTPAKPPEPGKPNGPFLSSGTVSFRVPGPFRPAPGRNGWRWLECTISLGNFGSGSAFRPPVVESFKVVSRWPLPLLTDLRLAVHVNQMDPKQQVAPEAGLGNDVALDLTKDFLPFGAKPRVGDVLYLASDALFAKGGAEVTLDVKLTNTDPEVEPVPAKASRNLILAWEFWDGRRWRLLGESGPGLEQTPPTPTPYQLLDKTNAFQVEGPVKFLVPQEMQPVERGGETRRWIRVRIAAGDYGREATYVPTGEQDRETHLPIYRLEPATFAPPSIRSLLLGYLFTEDSAAWEQVRTENDFRFDSDLLIDGTDYHFHPFVPTADTRPTLYLGFDRPGDAIGFANRAVSLYFGVAGAQFDPATEQQGTLEDAVVVWEYSDGWDWQRLGTRDETRGFNQRGLVTFIGPPDFYASTEFGRTAFWLRARWERGSYSVEPALRRVLTNTMWAVHSRTLEDEVLGSSRGEQDQAFRTAQQPVLLGQRLEVIEPEVPSGLDREELEREAREAGSAGDTSASLRLVTDALGRTTEVRVLWHEVQDFYTSGPRSRHYTLDRMTGEVRFGDGRRGLIPPAGRNNVRLSYRAGGGLAGNRPAGHITQLRGTVPYVDSVVQHEPAEGGAAEESVTDLVARGPLRLRHRDRAVAPTDFEDLAFEASTQVARARCVPARDGTDAGTVGLIVVPTSTAAKPVPTLELLARVRAFLEARVSPTLDLWVVGPDWLEVRVQVEIVPQVLEAATDVQNTVLERLAAFLHPLTGGLDGAGWAFGRKPYRSDLYALIEGTPGVDHVRRLQVTEIPQEGGARPERFLVFSGSHQVTVISNTDESAADLQDLEGLA